MQDWATGIAEDTDSMRLSELRADLRSRKNKSKEGLVAVREDTKTTVVAPAQVSKVLFRAHGFWPFDFFPDELIIEEKRIVVKKNYFPFGSTVVSLPISRLYTFELINSIFFSSIHIRGEMFGKADIRFAWLKHKEAKEAKDLVDGLCIRESEPVEIIAHDKEVLTKTIEAIGQA